MTTPQNPNGPSSNPWGQPGPYGAPGSTPGPGGGYPGQVPYPGTPDPQGPAQYPGAPQYPGAQQYAGAPQYPGSQQYPGAPAYPGAGGYAAPGGAGAPPPEPVRPSTVTIAFGLWMAALALAVVNAILQLSGDYLDRVVNQTILEYGYSLTASEVRTTVYGAVVGTLLVSAFLYIFFGLKMYYGRNWARVVLTVLGALIALSGVARQGASTYGDIAVEVPPGGAAMGWIALILAVGAVIAMYLKDANTYFSASKARRIAMKYGRY